MPDQETIPVRRVLAGFLIAPLPPALLFSVGFPLLAAVTERNLLFVFQSVILLPWVLVAGGYLPELFVGLPLYALARRWVRPTLINCVVAGAFVAALPWALMAALSSSADQSMIIDTRRAGFGVFGVLKMVGGIGALGALGGGVFWSVVAGPWSKGRVVKP